MVVVEKGGVPRYSGLKLPSPGGDLEDPLGKWILSNNAPLVNELGKFNFRALGKLGPRSSCVCCVCGWIHPQGWTLIAPLTSSLIPCPRPCPRPSVAWAATHARPFTGPGKLLVIGITDPTNETATPAFRAGLETLAKSVEFRDAYVFGHLDGVFFKEYIAQFNIYGVCFPSSSPRNGSKGACLFSAPTPRPFQDVTFRPPPSHLRCLVYLMSWPESSAPRGAGHAERGLL